ncbi:hypothetical protein GLOIN_2v1596541, partial [Rhizophagus irregularis DAOM 181602=DAOM 197198]
MKKNITNSIMKKNITNSITKKSIMKKMLRMIKSVTKKNLLIKKDIYNCLYIYFFYAHSFFPTKEKL